MTHILQQQMSDSLPIAVVPKETEAPSGPPPEDRAVYACLRPSFPLPASLINPSQNICTESRWLGWHFHLRSTSVLIALFNHLWILGGMQNRHLHAGGTDKEVEGHRGEGTSLNSEPRYKQDQRWRSSVLPSRQRPFSPP